jgi:hypothetical protein
MPYLSCPAPDITYHLINASPVGTGEQLLDGLLFYTKHIYFRKSIPVVDGVSK